MFISDYFDSIWSPELSLFSCLVFSYKDCLEYFSPHKLVNIIGTILYCSLITNTSTCGQVCVSSSHGSLHMVHIVGRRNLCFVELKRKPFSWIICSTLLWMKLVYLCSLDSSLKMSGRIPTGFHSWNYNEKSSFSCPSLCSSSVPQYTLYFTSPFFARMC